MSAISLKSITGITSITTPAGVDNQLTLHTNNTTERVKIDVAGNVHVNNHLAVAGVTTFASNIDVNANIYGRNLVLDGNNSIKYIDADLANGNSISLRGYVGGSYHGCRKYKDCFYLKKRFLKLSITL